MLRRNGRVKSVNLVFEFVDALLFDIITNC